MRRSLHRSEISRKIRFLSVVFLVLGVSTVVSSPTVLSSPDEADIRVFEEYFYYGRFDPELRSSNTLSSHSLKVFAQDLSDEIEHNLTISMATQEKIGFIHFDYPSGIVRNVSRNGKQSVTALFNGTECMLEFFLSGSLMPSPINLSLVPNDIEFFSADENGRVKFGVWLNTSDFWDNVLLQITHGYPSPIVETFTVQTDLEVGTKWVSNDEIRIKLLTVRAGHHYIEFEVDYGTPQGSFVVTASATKSGDFVTPTDIYLDGAEIVPENHLYFSYQTYNVEFIEGAIPWIYGYRDFGYYILNYTSPRKFVLRFDKLSRERIEFLILNSKAGAITVTEIDVYGNPCYQLEFDLDSGHEVSLGLGLREKVWFLRPSIMKVQDIPSGIREIYLNPASSYDGEYIDKDDPLVKLWAKQVVQNETNPYFIAFRLFQNLTSSLTCSNEYESFQHSKEYVSKTLKERKGVCRHFARAYVALCMSSGLPARTAVGTAFGYLNETYKKNHEWSEVFFPKYGWVSIDVTWEEFGLLSNSHSFCTLWSYVENTLNVSKMDDQTHLVLAAKSEQVLLNLIETVRERIDNLADNEAEKCNTLLEQAKVLAQQRYVHESLFFISKANVIIETSNDQAYQCLFSILSHPIVSTVLTILSGAAAFVLGRYLYDWYMKPLLEIVKADELITPQQTWWRVIVKNSGRTAAENCTGSIHLFGTDSQGNNLDTNGSVCWSILGNPEAITINVDDEQALDIYCIDVNQRVFKIPTEKGWNYIRMTRPLSDFLSPAKLKIRIHATAKNTKSCERTFLLESQQNNVVMIP